MDKEKSTKQNKDTETEEILSLEDAFKKLEAIVAQLEDPEASLEESFALYEEGMRLVKSCNERIDRVEKVVLMLNAEGGLDEF